MNSLKLKEYKTPGGVIKYWTAANTALPAIFLLHGAAMDHDMFNDQLEILDDYNVIAWDARGHGKSRPIEGTFTINDLANDAIAILGDQKIDNAIFIGQSEGGMIVQEIYRIKPSIVRGIITIGASPIMLPYSKLDIWLLNFSTSMIKIWPYKNFMSALAKKTSIKPSVQKYALKVVGDISKKDFLNVWSGVTSSLSVAGIKDMHISVPLLLTYGEKDTTGTVKKNNIRWKKYEDTADLVVIPDAGHNANQDNPAFFNQLVANFLAKKF